MKKALLLLILFALGFVKAQSLKEKIADKKFATLEFASAAPIYAELSSGKKAKSHHHIRAAECYLYLGEHKKAETYYEKVYTSYAMADQDLYNYYQVLKYNADYAKAEQVFAKISSDKYKLIRDNIKKKKLNLSELKKDSGNFILRNLPINSPENDFCPYLYNNELYFLSSRRNTSFKGARYGWDNSYYLDAYKAIYKNGAFTEEKLLQDHVNTKTHEGPLCFTNDGKTEFITKNSGVMKKAEANSNPAYQLKLLYRTKENDKWSEWKSFPYNSDDYSCGHPAVNKEGTVLYFVSDMPGTYGQSDIWVSYLKNGKWEKPINLGPSVNSEGRELFPMLYDNEVLFYSSDGKIGLGGLDVFYTLAGEDNYFEAQNLGYPLNSEHDDFGFFAQSDTNGYLSSNRGSGKDDIYCFSNKKHIISGEIHLLIKDSETKEVVKGADLALYDEKGKIISHHSSDENGEVKLYVLAGKNYRSTCLKAGYSDKEINLNESEFAKNPDSKKVVFLDKKIYGITALIVDGESLVPIEKVNVTIFDASGKQELNKFSTDVTGQFKKIFETMKKGDELNWTVKIEKEGYISKTQAFKTTVNKEGFIVMSDAMNMKLYKIKLGADIGKMIDLKPIYFDLGKFSIREDAAIELNKIVGLMKENPSMTIELGSHTDCRGTASSNLSLSDKRAKSSAAYIVSNGIDKTRIYGKGYGESKLINNCKCEGAVQSNCDEDTHAQNRRTEFKIVKIKN